MSIEVYSRKTLSQVEKLLKMGISSSSIIRVLEKKNISFTQAERYVQVAQTNLLDINPLGRYAALCGTSSRFFQKFLDKMKGSE